jgi:hypothetical protein
VASTPISHPKTTTPTIPAAASRFGGGLSVVVVGGAVIAVVVALVITLLSGTSPAPPGPSRGPALAVGRALVSTLTASSIELEMTVTDTLGGQALTVRGTAGCLPSRAACELFVHETHVVRGKTQVFSFHEIETLSAVDIELPVGTDKHRPRVWLTVPLGSPNFLHVAEGYNAEDPLQGFAALAGFGAKVTNVRATTVAGSPATQYFVRFPPARFLHLAHGMGAALPTWVASHVIGTSYAQTAEHLDVGADGRIVLLSFAHLGTGTNGSFAVTAMVTAYNANVAVRVPPAGDLLTPAKLAALRAAAAKNKAKAKGKVKGKKKTTSITVTTLRH